MSSLSWFVLIKNFLSNRWIVKSFLKFPSFRQFIKFSLVGILNTLIDFLIYFALTRVFPWFLENYLLANAIAFIVAATNSFYLNKRWTFNNKAKATFQYIKFLAVSVFTLALVEISLYFLVTQLGIFDIYAKIIVLILSVISNFFLNKFLVFKT